MKKSSILCIVGLTSLAACTNAPHSKKEHGSAPIPFVESLPSIAETPSLVDGGAIPGKFPIEVTVSPSIKPRSELSTAVDVANSGFGGVNMSMTIEEAIAVFGPARVVKVPKSTYFVFDSQSIAMIVNDSANGKDPLKSQADFMLTMGSFGGKVLAPESLGDLKVGKTFKDGVLSSVSGVETLAQTLGALAAKAKVGDYDCYAEGTCASVPMENGNQAILLPHALIQITPSGVVSYVEFDKAERKLPKSVAAPSSILRYGMSIGGLSMDASAKELAHNWGPAETVGDWVTYNNKKIFTRRDADGNLKEFSAERGGGYILAADGSLSAMQLYVPLEAEFNCKSLTALAIASLDPTAKEEAVICDELGGNIYIDMPGATLQLSSIELGEPAREVAFLANFGLRLRPIVYGESIAGLKIGFDEAETAKLYGPLPDRKEIEANNGRVILTNGLVANFAAKDGKYLISQLEAGVQYRGLVFNNEGKAFAQLGTSVSPLSFGSEQAISESFKFFAQTLEGGYLESLRAATPGLNPDERAPAFNADVACSMVPEKTETCFFLKSAAPGTNAFSVILPHMVFAFDASHVLTYVSL